MRLYIFPHKSLYPVLLFLLSLCFFHTTSARSKETLDSKVTLLQNGGFDEGLTAPWGTGKDSQDRPIWWNSPTCRSSTFLDRQSFKSGFGSLHIVNASGRSPDCFGTSSQRIQIEPGKTYRIILWAKAYNLSSDGAVSITVDPDWKVRPIVLPAGHFSWTRFEGTFSLPSSTADIRIITEDRSDVWLDEMVIVADQSLFFPQNHEMTWSGREGNGWDFVLFDPELTGEHRVAMKYLAQQSSTGEINRGQMHITIWGRHLKAELTDPAGQSMKGFDGIVSENRSQVWGTSWNLPGAGPSGPKRIVWWATLEKGLPLPDESRLDINQSGVAQLEALGLSSRNARTLVEGRMFSGKFDSVEEAGNAPGLSEKEKKILEDHFIAQ